MQSYHYICISICVSAGVSGIASGDNIDPAIVESGQGLGFAESTRNRVSLRSVDNGPKKRPRTVELPEEVPVRPVRKLTPGEQEKIRNRMTRSVVGSTYQEYVDRWQDWITFANDNSFDLYLRGYDRTGRIAAVCLLITTLAEQGSGPRVVEKVILSMKFIFEQQMIDGRDFLNDKAINRTRRGCKPRGRQAFVERTTVDRQPVTWDMVEWVREEYSNESTEGLMSYIGIALAFNFMWRASEYIGRSSSGGDAIDSVHALKRSDVTCYDKSGKVIPPAIIRKLTNLSLVDMITFVIKSSKSDQTGKGRFLSLTREGGFQNQLVNDVVRFLRSSATEDNHFFMSRCKRGRNLKLTRKVLTDVLKAAAEAKGLSGACFALHSLRIGGATQMAASSSDPGMIDRVGGWSLTSSEACRSSKISLGYRRSTVLDHGAVGAIDSCDMKLIVGATDVKKMIRNVRR